MQSQHYYYNVVRLNNQHTTVEPGDTFNFDIEVIYHTVHTIPHGLRNRFSQLSISCREFVQEGQNFLGSLLSGLSFSIESIAEISESVVSTVQELFEDSSIASESQHRIIPLSLTIIIVDPAGIDGVMEESRTFPGINQSNETILMTFLKKRTDTEGSEECCICLEGLNINCDSCTMPCHHAFHQQCILKWLKTNRVCPLCRYPLPTPEN